MPQPTATPKPSPTPGISPEALAYLKEVFEIVQTHALNRDRVDWEALKEKVYTDEQTAQTPADTYDSVRRILVWLNDGHSRFMSAEEAAQFNSLETSSADNPPPEGWLSEDGYAYLFIPQFASGDLDVNHAYANQLQQIVKELDAGAPCGWVIDLRENRGGNLSSMVPGLSGLLPDGEIYAFQKVTGEVEASSLINGQYIDYDGEVVEQVDDPLAGLQHPDPAIAILIGPYTTSAGEMLALTFKGLSNVAYFGHETSGKTTGIDFIYLSDGAILLLTSSVFVDRTGQVYGGSFQPDIPLEGIYKYPKTIPPTVKEWLETQETCQP